ncbi:MAG TPA: FtsX-like permease family protein [Pyrinomonadaceae bacterium]|nr:FtsX-like permease family protein [Pyrinomonadaceae bacterium]
MIELVLAGFRARPFRTALSILGVALGVVLIVLFTGLSKGMVNDMAKRANNWKAEIVFTRPGAMELTSSHAPVSTAYAERLMQIEGVETALPVYRYIMPDSSGRWGIRQIDGVDWEPFAKMNQINLVAGRPPQTNDEVVVDERQFRDDKMSLEGEVTLFGGNKYKVVGVFAPPSGSRIKMQLAAMQQATGAPGKCTYILVKIKEGQNAEQVASRINAELPGNKVDLTSELIADAQDRVPGLKLFLRVLVGLGAFVSTIFVLLSMYTTITERRREIGILKSLGASKLYIVSAVEGEALAISIFGILFGLLLSAIGALIITDYFELAFEYSAGWILIASVIAILGSLLGALYPAWRASKIDPVEVMANE